MATLVELFTVRDASTVLQQLYAGAAARKVDVVGVQAERLFRALYEIEADWKAREDYRRFQLAQAGFLGTVKQANYEQDGTYLGPPNYTDLIAEGWFNLARWPAVATVGEGVLTCSAFASPGTVRAMQARFISDEASGAVRYRNKYAFTVVPGAAVPVVLLADEAGRAGNVPVNAITTMETTIGGCSFNNPGTSGSWITSPGSDIETDDSLIARCFARWAWSSYGGARSAYMQWIADAFTDAGLTPTITRIGVDDTNPNGPGSTDLYLANSLGPASATELAVVDAFLQARRGLGTGPLRVFATPTRTIPIYADIYGNASGVALGTSSLMALEGVIGIGRTVFLSSVYAALSAPSIPGVVPPNGHVEIAAPTADVILTGFEVPVFDIHLTATA